jgi:predicted neuraminidase
LIRSIVLALGALSVAAVGGDALFRDDFESPSIARKPEWSIVYDAKDPSRRIQNPAIIEGQDGVLIAAWSNKGARGDNDPSDIIMSSTSADGGKTWSTPIEACPPSSINATFIRARNGDPVLFFNKNHSTIQDDTAIAFRRSTDNGKTYSATTDVDIGARVAIIVHNGLVLPNGEWLISFQYDRSGQGEPFDLSKIDFVAAVAISADEGRTWHRYGAIEIPNLERTPNRTNFAVEPAVYTTGPRSLGMILRTRNGLLYQATSADNGRTWSNAVPMPFSNDNCKPAALTLPNGHVVMFWNNMRLIGGPLRFPLMASLSTDRGRTWPHTVTIEDDNVQLDYPTAIYFEGALKIVYGYNVQQVRQVNLREQDLEKLWTPIGLAGAWSAHGGVLSFDGGHVENAEDWLRWSKMVAFLPRKPATFTLDADVRFDGQDFGVGSLGVFPAYQDEVNWTGWVWQPRGGKVGFEHQVHAGTPVRPSYSRNITETFFETVAPQAGKWYRLRIAAAPGRMEWTLSDRDTGMKIFSANNKISWEGQFIALGGRDVRVSFDNVVLR